MLQLWEMESATLVDSYATEDAALQIVRDAVEKHGRDVMNSVVLLREGAGGHLTRLAEGAGLVELALARTSPAA